MENLIKEKEIERRNREAQNYINHVKRERLRQITRFVEVCAVACAILWIALICTVSCF